MKKFKCTPKFESGFSLAELLISITISMIIAVAMVPVIGMKKNKVPINNFNHGIAECYYDKVGHLQFYMETTDRNADIVKEPREDGSHPHISGSVCTFDLPRAHYFEIITIGAGGDGNINVGPNDFTFNTEFNTDDNVPTIEGEIRLNEHYQEDIENAQEDCISQFSVPDKLGNVPNAVYCTNFSQRIRNAIRQWSTKHPDEVVARFEVASPLGKSGASICEPCLIKAANSQCPNSFGPFDINKFPGCPGPFRSAGVERWTDRNVARTALLASEFRNTMNWVYLHGQGSTSGQGKRTKNENPIDIQINDNSQISIERGLSRAGFSVNGANYDNKNRYFYLTASQDGVSPEYGISSYTSNFDAESHSSVIESNIKDLYNLDNIVENSGVNAPPAAAIEGSLDNLACTAQYSHAVNGSVTAPGVITWSFQPTYLRANSSPRGGYGEYNSRIYENLSGNIRLVPAQSTSVNSWVGFGRTFNTAILLSHSGSNAPNAKEEHLFQITQPDLPMLSSILDFSKARNREHFGEYLNKINSLNFHGGLYNCDETTCPGFAGSSPYPYITSIDNRYILRLRNSISGGEFDHETTSDSSEDSDYNGICADGSSRASGSGIGICRENHWGNKGAVIIIW